ncbi:host attachment protein [Zavarzinia sp. CC-PAN008]|uniref:host attachment protein n=1 Tax=Zavarzinia sp. CC-PAN008 TaxID=3243332 RepID=UPI003F74A66A
MEPVTIPRNGWVLVCDGAKALTFRNEGSAVNCDLQTVDVMAHQAAKTSELGSDRPGRVQQSHGTARSGVEQTDYHDLEEQAFLARVAAAIDAAVREHEIRSLVVVAPPRALGVLRKELSDAVCAVVTQEIPKDLVGMPTSEITRHLAH